MYLRHCNITVDWSYDWSLHRRHFQIFGKTTFLICFSKCRNTLSIGGNVILQKCFIFFTHFPKVSIVDKNNFCTFFFWGTIFKVPRARVFFSVVKYLCIFWECGFFKLYILALCLKSSIHPQLNTSTRKRTLKIVHFVSSYWNNLGKCF